MIKHDKIFFIVRNFSGVHVHLSKFIRGTWSEKVGTPVLGSHEGVKLSDRNRWKALVQYDACAKNVFTRELQAR